MRNPDVCKMNKSTGIDTNAVTADVIQEVIKDTRR